MCALWLIFLLLRELAERVLRRILIAMAELSFGKPTKSSRCARCELSSHYMCTVFPDEGRPSKALRSASRSLERRSR